VIDIEAFRDRFAIPNSSILVNHMNWCVVHDDGPCTCGADELQTEFELEEAGLMQEDLE
jgi:glyoxylate carboligase